MSIKDSIIKEFAVGYQKDKAVKALAKAKELEKKRAKKNVRLNSKTIVLR